MCDDEGSDGGENCHDHDNDDGHDNYDNPIQGTSYRAPMIDAMTNMDNKLTDTKKVKEFQRCKRLKSANKINSYNPANSVFKSETNTD